MTIYLIGSLRNPEIPKITLKLMEEGFDVFSEWHGAGEKADDAFRDYHKALGRTYMEALKTDAAQTIFNFDKKHIDKADTAILVSPAGKSGHLELGYALGCGKRGYYLLDDPERWDLMLQFCTGVFTDLDSLIRELKPVIPDLTTVFATYGCVELGHEFYKDTEGSVYCRTCEENELGKR